MTQKLLLGTSRQGKIKEFLAILKNFKFQFLTLKDINFSASDPQENGQTFSQNAALKARFYGRKSGLLTLADDSGLLVDALPNKLGVKSKRYAPGTDQDRWQKLLRELKGVPSKKRGAEFRAAIALFDPQNDKLKVTTGCCRGRISYQPKGQQGFGFDPVFIVNSLNKHLAELSLWEKNQVSHRAQALSRMKKYLKKYES